MLSRTSMHQQYISFHDLSCSQNNSDDLQPIYKCHFFFLLLLTHTPVHCVLVHSHRNHLQNTLPWRFLRFALPYNGNTSDVWRWTQKDTKTWDGITFCYLSIYISGACPLWELPSMGQPQQTSLHLILLHASLTYTIPYILPPFLSLQYSTLFHVTGSLPLTPTPIIPSPFKLLLQSFYMPKTPQSITFHPLYYSTFHPLPYHIFHTHPYHILYSI